VSDDVDIAAFNSRRLVVLVVAAVVGDELAAAEHWVELVYRASVQRFALAGGHRHGVDGHAAVDPTRVVALEQMVGQRRQNEVVGLEHVPLQAVGAGRVQITFQDASDQELGQRLAVLVLEEAPYWIDERRAEQRRRTQSIENEGATGRKVERFGEQLAVVVDEDALVAQRLGERVVLLFGFRGPHHVVEQQRLDVVWGQPRQLKTGSVHDRLAELTDLGSDGEGHRCSCT
jgi:hypothetical protein